MKLVKDIDKTLKDSGKVSEKEVEEAFVKIIKWIGEDPSREGLVSTPKRLVKAFREYFKGYSEDPEKILEKTFGDVLGMTTWLSKKIFHYKVTASITWHQLSEWLI